MFRVARLGFTVACLGELVLRCTGFGIGPGVCLCYCQCFGQHVCNNPCLLFVFKELIAFMASC